MSEMKELQRGKKNKYLSCRNKLNKQRNNTIK